MHFFWLKKYLPTWDPLFFCGQKCINPTRFHQTCPRETHVGPTDRFQAGIYTNLLIFLFFTIFTFYTFIYFLLFRINFYAMYYYAPWLSFINWPHRFQKETLYNHLNDQKCKKSYGTSLLHLNIIYIYFYLIVINK